MDYLTLQHQIRDVSHAIAGAFDFASQPSTLNGRRIDVVRTWRPPDWAQPPEAIDHHLRHHTRHGAGLTVWDLGCNLDLILDTGGAVLRVHANPAGISCAVEDPCRCDLGRLATANHLSGGRLAELLVQGGQQALASPLT
jgi:hypothetical protein